VLLGEYRHALDSKGRLIIPARFREELGAKFVVTKGLDSCLFVYPEKEWMVIATRLQELPFTRADARAFVRLFLAGASEVETDTQGRILVSASLRLYAGIVKEACLIGVGTRVEIWDVEKWELYSQQSEAEFGAIADKMADLGI
jgi:MraZ protein